MPPSITFWNRLEPRSRINEIAQSLAAEIRDPLWLLARQWQLGEFSSSDSGSPVYVELQAQAGPISGLMSIGATTGVQLAVPPPPLEPIVESEPFTPDLATRVELGQWFESLIGTNAGVHMIDDLRSTYPLPLVPDQSVDLLFSYGGTLTGLDGGTLPPDLLTAFRTQQIAMTAPTIWAMTAGSQWLISDVTSGQNYGVVKNASSARVFLCRDAEALRFLRVCAGRACDGVAILKAFQNGAAILPTRSQWSAQQIQALAQAGESLNEAVRIVYGEIGVADPASWMPDRLSLNLNVAATNAASTLDVLSAIPGPNGEFNWTSFDLLTPAGTLSGVTAAAVTSLHQVAMPGHIRFRGMPNARWWEFETGQTDFGDVQPEKRDLTKLVFLDFMLIHGDDWYLLPLDAPRGSVVTISGLYVHDVFGVVTEINPANTTTASAAMLPGQQWSMFAPTWIGQPAKVGSYLVISPSAWPTALPGSTVEEVRLLRDPVADAVWGVETVTESAIGRAWPGRERDQAGKPARTENPDSTPQALRYRLHSSIPVNWIPFVPVAQSGGNFTLGRAVLTGDAAGAAAPAGRILQTANVREQEVSTQGTVVSRVVCRSRWTDGSTRLWISRRRSFGLGQGSSGLRFDEAVTNP